MPERETLEKIGFRGLPPCWKEKLAVRLAITTKNQTLSGNVRGKRPNQDRLPFFGWIMDQSLAKLLDIFQPSFTIVEAQKIFSMILSPIAQPGTSHTPFSMRYDNIGATKRRLYLVISRGRCMQRPGSGGFA